MILGKKPIGTIGYMGGVLTVPEPFAWSFAQMVQYNTEYLCEPGQVVHYERATVSYHAYARNCLVERLRGDWLLMLDTDHQFEPDLAARMLHRLEQNSLDVLVGLYHYKSPPHSPVLYRWGKKGLQPLGQWQRFKEPYLVPIGSSGAGCLMVRRQVFEKIRATGQSPFDIIPPFSEDHSFFKRLARLKIKAYCDPTIEYHHLAWKPLAAADFDASAVPLSRRYATKE